MKYRTLRKWRLNRTLKQRGGFEFGDTSTPEEDAKVAQIMLNETEKKKYEELYGKLKEKPKRYKLNPEERIASLVHTKITLPRPTVANRRSDAPVSRPVTPLSGSTPTRGRLSSLSSRENNFYDKRSGSLERGKFTSNILQQSTAVRGTPLGVEPTANVDGPSQEQTLLQTEPLIDTTSNPSSLPGAANTALIAKPPENATDITVSNSTLPAKDIVDGSIVQSGPVDADIIEGAIVPSVPDAREVAFFREKIPDIELTVFNPKDFNFFAQFRQKLTDFINEARYIELLRANII
jgi:hypothetical protein